MFSLLKKVGWIGGVVALARTPQGQRAIAHARAYATNPETRRKIGELRSKIVTTSK